MAKKPQGLRATARQCERRGKRFRGAGRIAGAAIAGMIGADPVSGAEAGETGGAVYGCLTAPATKRTVASMARTVGRWLGLVKRRRRRTRPAIDTDEAVAMVADSWSAYKPGPKVYMRVQNSIGWQRVEDRRLLSRATLVDLYGPQAREMDPMLVLAGWRSLWDRTLKQYPGWEPSALIVHVIARFGDFLASSSESDDIEWWPVLRTSRSAPRGAGALPTAAEVRTIQAEMERAEAASSSRWPLALAAAGLLAVVATTVIGSR